MPNLFKQHVKQFNYFSIPEFYANRNKLLILRSKGGLGDILMHRMLFEDFKLLNPECHTVFALPVQYHDAVKDHPFIDEIIDCNTVNRESFISNYNTSSACIRYELKMAPLSGDHRSDIWAAQCGIKLTRHNMHIKLTEDERNKGKEIIERHRANEGPTVIIAPISTLATKNLLPQHQKTVTDYLKQNGYCPLGLHSEQITELEAPTIYNISIREWMAVISEANYVISVDTSVFHCAGGLGKPLMGVYTFADGKVYGKYFDFILVQKHRDDGNWPCGPCYAKTLCPHPGSIKPCLSEITSEMLVDGLDKMFKKWPKILF